ncbi:MAG: HAD hydrolase family protein [Pseudomonadota bacterium]
MPAPPRLLALDLDGTLCRRDGSVHPDDRAAIARLQARGVRVCLVTGRLYSGVRALAEELRIRDPLVCADGAEIVDPASGRVLAHRRLEGEASRALFGLLALRPLDLFLLAQDRLRHDHHGRALARYVRNWTPAILEVEDVRALPHWRGSPGISIVVAAGSPEQADAAVAAVRADGRFSCDGFAIRLAPGAADEGLQRGLLVRAPGVDKGRALQDLCATVGCDLAEVVAVGDWVNDIPMLRIAGRSFVMGGAEPEVRAAAHEELTARAWMGGGVAEAAARVWAQESDTGIAVGRG